MSLRSRSLCFRSLERQAQTAGRERDVSKGRGGIKQRRLVEELREPVMVQAALRGIGRHPGSILAGRGPRPQADPHISIAHASSLTQALPAIPSDRAAA